MVLLRSLRALLITARLASDYDYSRTIVKEPGISI
jgi:hypothetical protein